jgi:hypothetical protein
MILLWHNSGHAPPEITPVASPTFPRIGVDKGEVVPQTGIAVLGLIVLDIY